MDIFGEALLDFHQNKYTEDIVTTSNITEADIMPLPYLFRGYNDMPELEKKALQMAHGRILDVGCGAGSHSLYLQDKNYEVTAIDSSEGAAKVASERGVLDVRNVNLLDMREETYDTILLLMNGTGIFGSLTTIASYLNHLKTLLREDGQILIDSSDLQFMYDRNDDGSIWVPADRYYGELDFTLAYKGKKSEPFQWLYLDPTLFKQVAHENGYAFRLVSKGEHFDYLAQLKIHV